MRGIYLTDKLRGSRPLTKKQVDSRKTRHKRHAVIKDLDIFFRTGHKIRTPKCLLPSKINIARRGHNIIARNLDRLGIHQKQMGQNSRQLKVKIDQKLEPSSVNPRKPLLVMLEERCGTISRCDRHPMHMLPPPRVIDSHIARCDLRPISMYGHGKCSHTVGGQNLRPVTKSLLDPMFTHIHNAPAARKPRPPLDPAEICNRKYRHSGLSAQTPSARSSSTSASRAPSCGTSRRTTSRPR